MLFTSPLVVLLIQISAGLWQAVLPEFCFDCVQLRSAVWGNSKLAQWIGT